jgi:hypothetical protein
VDAGRWSGVLGRLALARSGKSRPGSWRGPAVEGQVA